MSQGIAASAPTLLATVSVCLTVLNEEKSLPSFFESFDSQSAWPREIIVVDGGSTDRTVPLLRAWQVPEGVSLTLVIREGANISQGRNTAIDLARGEWIVATDAGTTLSRDWLMALSARMTPSVSVVSGFFEPQPGRGLSSVIGAVITPLLSEINPTTFLPSSRSVAFRKSAWTAAGGYPEWLDYCEDLVFDLKMKDNGEVFVFASDAVAAWDARPSLHALFRQYYRYARGDGKARLWRKRHAARYGAYVGGIGLLAWGFAGQRLSLLLLAAGTVGYFAKFFRRAWSRRSSHGRNAIWSGALVPVIVVVGDIAKMLGYPVGVAWRRTASRNTGGALEGS